MTWGSPYPQIPPVQLSLKTYQLHQLQLPSKARSQFTTWKRSSKICQRCTSHGRQALIRHRPRSGDGDAPDGRQGAMGRVHRVSGGWKGGFRGFSFFPGITCRRLPKERRNEGRHLPFHHVIIVVVVLVCVLIIVVVAGCCCCFRSCWHCTSSSICCYLEINLAYFSLTCICIVGRYTVCPRTKNQGRLQGMYHCGIPLLI